jgi:hypothetical protein
MNCDIGPPTRQNSFIDGFGKQISPVLSLAHQKRVARLELLSERVWKFPEYDRRQPSMALKYGRSKHMDAVSLADCLEHPIWVRAPDTSRYSEEGRRPISNKDAVDAEVLASRVPIITFRVRGTDSYGIGFYDHKGRRLDPFWLWHETGWVEAKQFAELTYPVDCIAIPPILDAHDVCFILKSLHDVPVRA